MINFVRNRPLLSYVVLAYGLTWLVILPEFLSVRGYISTPMPEHWESLGAFGPALAGFLIAYITAGKRGVSTMINSLTRLRVDALWIIFVVMSPLFLFIERRTEIHEVAISDSIDWQIRRSYDAARIPGGQCPPFALRQFITTNPKTGVDRNFRRRCFARIISALELAG